MNKPDIPRQTEEEVFFLSGVGQRIRAARKQQQLTRKELAIASGASERYLAQIETGTGNVSILILRQIARATSMPVSYFLSDEFSEPELLTISDSLGKLSEAHRAEFFSQARQWLDRYVKSDRQKRFALIGLRGAGKSTLGKRVAKQLDIPFIELTKEIEQESGLAISEVFSLYGQQGYRELENHCLKSLIDRYEQIILAVGGGITGDSQTFQMLLDNFHAVWLKASPEEHMQRVLDQGDRRPIKGIPQAMHSLKSILASRENHYDLAEFSLDTSGRSIEDCAEELRSMIGHQ